MAMTSESTVEAKGTPREWEPPSARRESARPAGAEETE